MYFKFCSPDPITNFETINLFMLSCMLFWDDVAKFGTKIYHYLLFNREKVSHGSKSYLVVTAAAAAEESIVDLKKSFVTNGFIHFLVGSYENGFIMGS